MNLAGPAQPVRHGGIAPVEPMAPGTEVVPVLFGKPHGKDEGNAFCMGVCYPNKEQAKCGKPYVSYPVAEGLPIWFRLRLIDLAEHRANSSTGVAYV